MGNAEYMGKSTWGSSTMRTSLISFGFLLLVPAILADSFAAERVKVGKKTCTCSFTFVLNGDRVNVKNSLVSCDKKCSGAAKDVDHRHRAWVRIWIPRDRHANGPWGLRIRNAPNRPWRLRNAPDATNRIWIRHASNWRGIWRVRSWILESLPRNGRNVPNGQR